MPRDLLALIKQEDDLTPGLDEASDLAPLARDTTALHDPKAGLHLYSKILCLADVDSCVVLEEMAFPPRERCTREKVSFILMNSASSCWDASSDQSILAHFLTRGESAKVIPLHVQSQGGLPTGRLGSDVTFSFEQS